MKKILATLVLIVVFQHIAFAQEKSPRETFVSLNGGAFLHSHDSFKDKYDGYVYNLGICLGVPFVNKGFYAVFKPSFMRKEGVTSRDEKINLAQNTFNLGIQYEFLMKNNFSIIPAIGANYVSHKEKIEDRDVATSKGVSGMTIGVGVEKRFNIPLAVLLDYQFDLNQAIFHEYDSNLGGHSLILGFKYYFLQINKDK